MQCTWTTESCRIQGWQDSCTTGIVHRNVHHVTHLWYKGPTVLYISHEYLNTMFRRISHSHVEISNSILLLSSGVFLDSGVFCGFASENTSTTTRHSAPTQLAVHIPSVLRSLCDAGCYISHSVIGNPLSRIVLDKKKKENVMLKSIFIILNN